jgi:hypothetical protein
MLTKQTNNLKITFIVLCLSIGTLSAQKVDEKKSLSVSGFAKYSQLSKYVKDLKKGKKLKKGEIAPKNKKNPNREYLDLLTKSKNTNNSDALYQFSINEDHQGAVTEVIRTGLGFMEPVYSIGFDMADMRYVDLKKSNLIKYYLIPNKQASRELHAQLKDVFNLVDFEESWDVFTKKFEANAANRAEEFLNEYFEFQDALSEEIIQKKVKQAEGSFKGSFAEISAVSKELSKNPIQKLKNNGKYRLHNSNYFKDFIAPINKKTGEDIGFVISPSTTIYKVFTKIITEPKLQPHHNIKLFVAEKLMKEKYSKKSKAYKKVLDKEFEEELKQYAIVRLKKALEIYVAKKKNIKSYTLTAAEVKLVESNTAGINKFIKDNDLRNTFNDKQQKEYSINLAKEWVKSEKKFRKYLDLYKAAMVSSNQFDILLSNVMEDVIDAEVVTASYPLSSKLSMLSTYKNFIKLDRKTSGASATSRLLGSIAKKTSFGKNITEQLNGLTAVFSGEINKIKTIEDAGNFVEKRAKILSKETNSLYFKNIELRAKINGYTKVHMQQLLNAKQAFKLSIGEGSQSLDD